MGLSLGVTAAGLNLKAFTAPVPRKAGEIAIALGGGQQLLLSSLKGKPIGLEFLLTTCVHCQRCSGILQQMYREFGPRGFQPVGAAINENASLLVPEFIQKLGVQYPVGVAPQNVAYEFLGASMIEPLQMPQLVFIDRKGIVRAQYASGDDFFRDEEANMRKEIEALLKGAAITKPVSARKRPA
jgi:hypothetical protein